MMIRLATRRGCFFFFIFILGDQSFGKWKPWFCTAQFKKHIPLLLKSCRTSSRLTSQSHAVFLTTGLFCRSRLHFNALLRCYSLGEDPRRAFLLHGKLRPRFPFDSVTHSFLIHACTKSLSLSPGTELHALAVKVGSEWRVHVRTALIGMYAGCDALRNALLLFDGMPERNSVTWNVMITGLVRGGEFLHARYLFEQMPGKNLVSWTVMIDAQVRARWFGEALALFRRMVSLGDEGVDPNEITMLAILPAISNTRDLRACRLFHGYSEKRGFSSSDVRVANSIIDTYSKCGCIESASNLFADISMEKRNLVSWTSIISAFALHGMGKDAIESFERMEKTGMAPNRVTFLSVLNACSHGGLVEEGMKLFEKMVKQHQILPDVKHYGCLVDMLGRRGRLQEAEEVALASASDAAAVVWRTLLGACSVHGDVDLGVRVARKMMDMEVVAGGDYVLLHNILTAAGRFQDGERLRNLLDAKNASKLPGHSLL